MVSLNNVNYITVKFIGKFSDKQMTIVKVKHIEVECRWLFNTLVLLWEYVAYYVGDTDIPDHYRGLATVRF